MVCVGLIKPWWKKKDPTLRKIHELRKGRRTRAKKKSEKRTRREGRKEGERGGAIKPPLLLGSRIKDLIPHTTRGRDFAYLVIFLVWGHGNDIG